MFEILKTMTLAEEGGPTRLTLHKHVLWMRPETSPMLAGMKQGWTESRERLAEFVTKS